MNICCAVVQEIATNEITVFRRLDITRFEKLLKRCLLRNGQGAPLYRLWLKKGSSNVAVATEPLTLLARGPLIPDQVWRHPDGTLASLEVDTYAEWKAHMISERFIAHRWKRLRKMFLCLGGTIVDIINARQ